MKIKIVVILVLLTTYLSPQNTTADNLIPYRKGDKWGFANKNKTIIIEPIYNHVSFFKEGFAVVNYNGNYGYIKPNGEKLIPYKYDYVHSFNEGLALVYSNRKYGYINKNGIEIIPIKYSSASDFNNGLASVSIQKEITQFGKLYHNTLDGFINKKGKVVIPFKYQFSKSFSEGLASVHHKNKSTTDLLPFDGVGFLNAKGELVINIDTEGANWIECGDFKEGFAFVKKYDENSNKFKFGYINKKGKIIIPIKYEFQEYFSGVSPSFSDGVCRFEKDNYWGYINSDNEIIIPFSYEYAKDFNDGLAPVKINNRYGFIDKSNKLVIPCKFEDALSFSEGLAAVRQNKLWGFIDKTGKVVIPLKYQSALKFDKGFARIYSTEANSKLLGYIDKNGTEYWED